MVLTKPADIRREQKKYFNIAYQGEPVVVTRPRSENVVVISEERYKELITMNRLLAYHNSLSDTTNVDVGSDDSLLITDELDINNKRQSNRRIIGIAEGMNLCNPEYDFDEYNDEIAKLFGVV